MKKIMFALVIGCIAAFAQASTVKWSVTSIKDADGNLIGATSDKYSALVTFYDSEGAAIAGATSSSTTSNAGSGMSGSWTGAALSTTYYADIVITEIATGNTLTSEKAQFATSASATYSINFANGTGFSTSGAKVNYNNWAAAPEPTSGLLLLLGVAGLALKRKRA